MKLAELAGKPKLILLTLDDEAIIKEFDEPLEFWTWDRQPMAQFVKLASIKDDNFESIIEVVSELVLDDVGKPILHGDETLPTKVLMAVVTKIVDTLGK